jgi:hemoglobin
MIRNFARPAAVILFGLAVAQGAAAADSRSLYDRLGGKPALSAVVGELWNVVSQDARINGRFAHTKPDAFGGQLVEFLCQASGGPCQYQGRNMKDAHTGMHLSAGDFDALAEDTAKVLDKFKVPATEKGEVLGLLGSLKGDVVNR